MLTQMSIKLTWWTEHKKQITSLDRKAVTYYFGPIIKVWLCHWFLLLEEDTPIDFLKQQWVEGRKEKKIVVEQSKETSLEVVTKE